MLQTYKSYTRRTLAMLLAVLVAVGALFSGSFPVHAADGTISYKAGANIPYHKQKQKQKQNNLLRGTTEENTFLWFLFL